MFHSGYSVLRSYLFNLFTLLPTCAIDIQIHAILIHMGMKDNFNLFSIA